MNANGFKITPQREEAATLVAEDRLSDREIAKRLGINVVTLERWKLRPEFRLLVADERDRLTAEMRRIHVADKQARIDGMVGRHKQLLAVILARAAAYAGQAPGSDTGLLARKVSIVKVYDAGDESEADEPGVLYSAKKFHEVAEFALDRPLLAELREIEAAIAKELGQITTKSDLSVTGKDGGPIVVQRKSDLTDDELDRRITELESQLLGSPDTRTDRAP